jgi:hypothetical protein
MRVGCNDTSYRIARSGGPEAIGKGLADCAAIGGAVDGLLLQQVQFDLDALGAASGRKLTSAARDEVAAVQTRTYCYTKLGADGPP